MDNLKSLLIFLLKNSPKPLGRTELMKYVYSFEYHYYQLFGKKFTDIQFIRYYYGPNDSSIVDASFELQNDGYIQIEEYINYYGGLSYSHRFVMEPMHSAYDLPEGAQFVASFIIDRLKGETVQGVKDYSYKTPPMREILEEERVVGRTLLGRVLDMSKTGPIFKSTRQRKEEAKKRLLQREQTRGSDEQYYEHMLEQYKRYEDTRRRANIAE